MSPHFSFINVLLLSAQMEVTSKEGIQQENCAQHQLKTLQPAHCRVVDYGLCGAQHMVVMSGRTPLLTSCHQNPRRYKDMLIQ